MRKKTLWKDIRQSITGSWGRFFSIFWLIAIGTFAFVGLKVTGPDMRYTAENFYDQTNLADMTLTSTWGLDEEDEKLLTEDVSISQVEFGYLQDVLLQGTDKSFRIFSAPEDLSQYEVVAGKMPKTDTEIAIDFTQEGTYQIGDTLEFDQGKADTLKTTRYKISGFVKSSEILVTTNIGKTTIGTGQLDSFGVVQASNFDSNVYMIARMDFTDTQGLNAYSETYNDRIKKHREKLKDAFANQSQVRLETTKADKQKEITDGWQEITAAKKELTDTQKQLDAAKQQLQAGQEEMTANQDKLNEQVASAQEQITNGSQQIAEAQQTIEESQSKLDDASIQLANGQASLSEQWDTLVSAKAELGKVEAVLLDSKAELAEAEKAISAAEQQIAAAEKEIAAKQAELDEAPAEIESAKEKIAENQAKIDEGQSKIEREKATLEQKKVQLESALDEINQQLEANPDNPELEAKKAELEIQYQEVLQGLTEVETSQDKLDGERANLDQAKQELAKQQDDYEKGLVALTLAKKEVATHKQELAKSKEDYQTGLTQYNAGITGYNSNLAVYYAGLAQWVQAAETLDEKATEYQENIAHLQAAKAELTNKAADLETAKSTLAIEQAQGQKQLDEAKETLTDKEAEYKDKLAEFTDKKADAEKEIQENEQKLKAAQTELDELEAPAYTVNDRKEGVAGYKQYLENSERVDILSNVFPVFLFAIAALVSLTTMTRFVEEERVNSGTLKALGYTNWDIKKKFVVYGIVSGTLGAALGTALGHTILPTVIFDAYAANSALSKVSWQFSPWYSFLGLTIALLCTTLSAYLVASSELQEKTAQLLQPKPPKMGSRILLERVKPLWNRMSFISKVTARNLFRYKKRMFMTIFGVAGCTALLITGFGIRDSLSGLTQRQFSNLLTYDMIVVKEDELSNEAKTVIDDQLQNDQIKAENAIHYESMTIIGGKNKDTQTISLIVPQEDNFSDFVHLVNRESQQDLDLSDDGVILTEKLAKLLNAKVGQTVTLTDSDDRSIDMKVTGITEMYMGHYAFMNKTAYQKAFDKEASSNGNLVTLANDSQKLLDQQSKAFMDLDGVVGIVQTAAVSEVIDAVMDGLNSVIIVLITCATLLAIVVIYNLTNINVSERVRELSTIKVLGFYDKEVTLYIYRETIILSIIGIIAGFAVGFFLHGVIMLSLPPDEAMFSPGLKATNFAVSAAMTMAITLLLMLVMHVKIKHIDMLEALKSVD